MRFEAVPSLAPTPDLPAVCSELPQPEESDAALEAAVNYILDDCFFSVGQAVYARKSLDHPALIWWRDHFRVKFLHALRRSGNTWLQDRDRVTAVAHLLAERAVRHAGNRPSIDRACAMKAAADVEAYCAIRAGGRRRGAPADSASPMHAGYWCLP